jgi:hypothetical protein
MSGRCIAAPETDAKLKPPPRRVMSSSHFLSRFDRRDGLFPLTPALSPGERGKRRLRAVLLDALEFVEKRAKWLPLPEP